MFFAIEKEVLTKLTNKIKKVADSNSSMPILSNVLLEAIDDDILRISATNLETFINADYSVSVKEQGKICLNADVLYNIAKTLPSGEVFFESNDENVLLTMKENDIKFTLLSSDTDSFPQMSNVNDIDFFKIDTSSFKELIDYTLFACAVNDPRIFLNGVCVEKISDKALRMVSTDGHRMSKKDMNVAEDGGIKLDSSVIIPKKGMIEIYSLLEETSVDNKCLIAFDKNSCFIKYNNTTLSVRNIEGNFPDYKFVISENFDKYMVLDRKNLISTVKRISYFSPEGHAINFLLSNKTLTIKTENFERGSATQIVNADFSNETIDDVISLNAVFLINVLEVLQTDNVKIYFEDSLSPIQIKQTDMDNFVHVLMPIR